MKRILVFIFCLLTLPIASFACTTVIISGKVTENGKPLMMKNRDSDELNSCLQYFKGPTYSFVGLVNSSSRGGEVWAGTNSAGLSIMNSASYNIKNDRVPTIEMDKEGQIMYAVLGTCATVADFEKYMNTAQRPYGVSANFGIIDAQGGAAYFEVNNYSYVKYDVNRIPCGYRVVTNFSESGSKDEYKGYERYLTASEVMEKHWAEAENGKMFIGPFDLFYDLSRSYKHSVTGIDYLNNYYSLKRTFGFTGVVPDQDFIPRKSTSSVVVFEGVTRAENPAGTVMWTLLGYPCCSVPVPVMVSDSDTIPYYLKSSDFTRTSEMCDNALKIKDKYIFNKTQSNGSQYVDISNIMDLLHCCLVTESMIEGTWQKIYSQWMAGKISNQTFKKEYEIFARNYYDKYLDEFDSFLQ